MLFSSLSLLFSTIYLWIFSFSVVIIIVSVCTQCGVCLYASCHHHLSAVRFVVRNNLHVQTHKMSKLKLIDSLCDRNTLFTCKSICIYMDCKSKYSPIESMERQYAFHAYNNKLCISNQCHK